jgi:hypothetical protein
MVGNVPDAHNYPLPPRRSPVTIICCCLVILLTTLFAFDYQNHAFFKLGTGHHYLVSTAAAPNLYICTNPGDHPLPTSARMFFLHSDNVAKIEFLNFHPNPPFQSLQLVFCCWSAKLKSHHLVSSGHSLQYGIHVAYPANHQLILKIIKIKTSSAG